MADPVADRTAFLADTWQALAGFRYPDADPTPDVFGGGGRRGPVNRLRALGFRRPYGDRPYVQTAADPYNPRPIGPDPDGFPDAPPEAVALRADLAPFFLAWEGHPVAQRMHAGAWSVRITEVRPPPVETVAVRRHLADLDALPAAAPYRAAVLTATAYTAAQERGRLAAAVPQAAAQDARRMRAQVDALADHYAAAVDLLPAAFAPWQTDALAVIESARKPSVTAYPTVPAVAYIETGRRAAN